MSELNEQLQRISQMMEQAASQGDFTRLAELDQRLFAGLSRRNMANIPADAQPVLHYLATSYQQWIHAAQTEQAQIKEKICQQPSQQQGLQAYIQNS
ncbi:MAG: hypothetical protein ACRC53_00625 [Plesiomonas sp.]|uniref:hypothetical protein n=1 Tax=Plesiomonas sp. TaxID=2486279 RepID=UPI003F36AF48